MARGLVVGCSLALALGCHAQLKPVELDHEHDVDILFVIDNSGSMGAGPRPRAGRCS